MFYPSPVEVENFKTKEIFILKPLISSGLDVSQLIQDIYHCCTEELIYKTLFAKSDPDGYPLSKAKSFIEYSETGWQDQTHFIFGIFHPDSQELVGAIDIKSPDKEKAEVGYWLSHKHSGLMTNALLTITHIAKEAGYKSLEIYTEVSNQKSEAVVKRAGFQYQETKEEDGDTNRYHLLKLN